MDQLSANIEDLNPFLSIFFLKLPKVKRLHGGIGRNTSGWVFRWGRCIRRCFTPALSRCRAAQRSGRRVHTVYHRAAGGHETSGTALTVAGLSLFLS